MQDVPELSEQYSLSSSLTSSSNGLSWADKVKTGTSAMNQRDSLSKVLLQGEAEFSMHNYARSKSSVANRNKIMPRGWA